jgi:hypothetical protein
MKKPILAGIAVIAFSAFSFAQNTSTLNQAGTNQTGIIIQVGDLHQATITQLGAGVNQGSLGFISQGSTDNTGATGNIGYINQNDGSKSNRAGIDQNVKPASGNGNNVATINQNGGYGYTSGGDGTMIQPSTGVLTGTTPMAARMVGGNWAGITQEGNGTNTIGTVNQNAGPAGGSSANFTNVYQNGTGSGLKIATVDQNNYSVNNNAILYQGDISGGLGNTVSAMTGAIEQSNYSANNTAEMYQTKGVQTALIQQNWFSNDNFARVNQSSTDNGNQATIQQSYSSGYNDARINQTAGAGRTAAIDQVSYSYFNIAAINQGGVTPGATASNAYILQTNALGNQAFINQDTRFGASATIYQHNTYGSYAKITQNTTYFDYGNSNVAEIEQTGSLSGVGNYATIDQDYSVNTAKLKQDGHGNVATIKQLIGDGNVVKGLGSSPVALQQGDNNTLTVTQTSASYLGPPFGPYTPNTANVQQIGTGNVGTIVQAGI